MDNRRGSIIVLAMFFLVLLSGIGIYVVSLPVSVAENAQPHYRETVAKNMARAGAHAAIARLPAVLPAGSPYIRGIPVGQNVTGRYSVTSRKIGTEGAGSVNGPGFPFDDYELVSEGSVADSADGRALVRAVIRFGPPGTRAQIRKWEEFPAR